jgi:chromosome segregation ATPase
MPEPPIVRGWKAEFMVMNRSSPAPAPEGFAAHRDEVERQRDIARQGALQGQVDELRQALRELASRQVRIEEIVRHYEGGVAQNRLMLEQFRHEAQQSAQARALDENRTRQQIGEMDQRLDDAIRPVRSLQAHVTELLEASRRRVDDTGQNQRRFEELRAMIDHIQAVSDRSSVAAHQVRDAVEAVKSELDQIRRDQMRNEDAVKIVDQEMRRRIAEVAESSESVDVRLDELRSDISHSFDLIDEVRRSIVHIDPALEELRKADGEVKQEVARVHQQALERHESLVDRIDDVRQMADGQVAEVRQAQDQRIDRFNERLDEAVTQYRELGVRISGLANHLDALKLADESIRRDLWQLHEQRVRLRLEQAQQELDQVTGMRRGENESPQVANPVPRPADR